MRGCAMVFDDLMNSVLLVYSEISRILYTSVWECGLTESGYIRMDERIDKLFAGVQCVCAPLCVGGRRTYVLVYAGAHPAHGHYTTSRMLAEQHEQRQLAVTIFNTERSLFVFVCVCEYTVARPFGRVEWIHREYIVFFFCFALFYCSASINLAGWLARTILCIRRTQCTIHDRSLTKTPTHSPPLPLLLDSHTSATVGTLSIR